MTTEPVSWLHWLHFEQINPKPEDALYGALTEVCPVPGALVWHSGWLPCLHGRVTGT